LIGPGADGTLNLPPADRVGGCRPGRRRVAARLGPCAISAYEPRQGRKAAAL